MLTFALQTSLQIFPTRLPCISSASSISRISSRVYASQGRSGLFVSRMKLNLYCRTWRRLASDNAIWRSLFARQRDLGWTLDLRRAKRPALTPASLFAASYKPEGNIIQRLPAPLELDWYQLYKARSELERRWSSNPIAGRGIEDKENMKVFEPRVRRLLGHTDRYTQHFAYHPNPY